MATFVRPAFANKLGGAERDNGLQTAKLKWTPAT